MAINGCILIISFLCSIKEESISIHTQYPSTCSVCVGLDNTQCWDNYSFTHYIKKRTNAFKSGESDMTLPQEGLSRVEMTTSYDKEMIVKDN